MLGPALGQAGHRRAMRAVDLKRDQVVAADTHAPGRIHVRDHTILKHECSVGRIICIRIVGFSVLIYTLRDVSGAKAAYRPHPAEQIAEHIAPVAEHIEDDAATLALATVPAQPLSRLTPISSEPPVSEFSPNREHASEKTGVAQHPDLAQAGQK